MLCCKKRLITNHDEKITCSNNKMLEYVFTELKYPEEARKKNTKGKVIAKFVITKTGEVSSIQVLRDIGDGCGEEVVRVLESMNNMPAKWTPGTQRGQNVNVEYTLPVVFNLD